MEVKRGIFSYYLCYLLSFFYYRKIHIYIYIYPTSRYKQTNLLRKKTFKQTLTELKTNFVSKHETNRIYEELILNPIISLEGFLGPLPSLLQSTNNYLIAQDVLCVV